VEGNCHFWAFPKVKASSSGRESELMISLPAPVMQTEDEVVCSHPASQERSRGRSMKLGSCVNNSRSGLFQASKSAQAGAHGIARQVRMYCFRFGNCGTFIPLSGVRSVFRIAVVWTRFRAAFFARSPIHVNVLFTRAVVLSAVDCK
jgi:hypothetical protein